MKKLTRLVFDNIGVLGIGFKNFVFLFFISLIYMPNNRTSRLMDIAGDVGNILARRRGNNTQTRRRSRSINDDIHVDDVVVDGRKYFDAVSGEERPFDMAEYLTYMNSLPARVANIYPSRSFFESERLMRGKYINNRPYLFRRNDVTEAARLYRDMNDYAKYIEHAPGVRESSPTLSRSRSRSRRSSGRSQPAEQPAEQPIGSVSRRSRGSRSSRGSRRSSGSRSSRGSRRSRGSRSSGRSSRSATPEWA